MSETVSSLDQISGFSKDTSVNYKASMAEVFFYKLYNSVSNALTNQVSLYFERNKGTIQLGIRS